MAKKTYRHGRGRGRGRGRTQRRGRSQRGGQPSPSNIIAWKAADRE